MCTKLVFLSLFAFPIFLCFVLLVNSFAWHADKKSPQTTGGKFTENTAEKTSSTGHGQQENEAATQGK